MTAIDIAALAFSGLMLIAAGVLAYLAGRWAREAQEFLGRAVELVVDGAKRQAAQRPVNPFEQLAKQINAVATQAARNLSKPQGGEPR